MSIYRTMRISATALTAERLRMDVISNNIANSQTTRTEEGGAYQRKQVVLADRGQNGIAPVNRFRRSEDLSAREGLRGVHVRSIVEDDEDMVLTYDPDHPDANDEGFVEYPNVDVTTEMVDMMAASKAYRANITVVQTVKSMAQAALRIGQ